MLLADILKLLMRLEMRCRLGLSVMNRTIVAIGIALFIISSLIFLAILLGKSAPPGYLSANVIWLFVAGIVIILWGLSSKK